MRVVSNVSKKAQPRKAAMKDLTATLQEFYKAQYEPLLGEDPTSKRADFDNLQYLLQYDAEDIVKVMLYFLIYLYD